MSSSSLSPFAVKSYYRISNVAYTGVTISTGFKNSSPSAGFTPSGSRSSENWQLYQQAGRYFIRNYDYGGDLQLGLKEGSRAIPQLLSRSGDLGQQWFLNQNDDGTWRITNGLLGNSSMLGVSDEISGTKIAPAMNPSPDGSDKWIITVNLSAGEIIDPQMLNDIPGITPVANASSSIFSTTAFASKNSTATATATSSVFSSGARPVHAPTRFYTCTTAGMYFVFTALLLFLVTAGLAWRRRARNPYQLVAVSDTSFGPDGALGEK